MIKLTDGNGKPIYISPDKILAVLENGRIKSMTMVCFGEGEDSYFNVTESPEEVVKMILEYKFSSRDYKGTMIESDSIYSLAGLE